METADAFVPTSRDILYKSLAQCTLPGTQLAFLSVGHGGPQQSRQIGIRLADETAFVRCILATLAVVIHGLLVKQWDVMSSKQNCQWIRGWMQGSSR